METILEYAKNHNLSKSAIIKRIRVLDHTKLNFVHNRRYIHIAKNKNHTRYITSSGAAMLEKHTRPHKKYISRSKTLEIEESNRKKQYTIEELRSIIETLKKSQQTNKITQKTANRAVNVIIGENKDLKSKLNKYQSKLASKSHQEKYLPSNKKYKLSFSERLHILIHGRLPKPHIK